jgi:hypothetical protein
MGAMKHKAGRQPGISSEIHAKQQESAIFHVNIFTFICDLFHVINFTFKNVAAA